MLTSVWTARRSENAPERTCAGLLAAALARLIWTDTIRRIPGQWDMKRRDLILATAGAALWSSTGRGQQASRIVGVLGIGSQDAVRANFAPAKTRMAEVGFIEGQNLAIEYRAADYRRDRLPGMAGDLVQRRVAALVAFSGPAVSAAKAATTSIPIIFFTGFDPSASGFVNSLNRPGGNVTGVSILTPELNFKRLELLHELVPAAKTIAFLYTRTGITSEDTSHKSVQQAAEALGVKMLLFSVSNPIDFDESFARAEGAGAGALIVNSDALFQNNRQKVIALAAHHKLPAMYSIAEYVADGGLISYGTNYTDAYRQVGEFVVRVLKGDKPENLPVQQVTKIELVINAKTAKSLGLTVPLALLGRADQVIE
jgi:putative tryptophan/tyrosine transport system substrate-binding protein